MPSSVIQCSGCSASTGVTWTGRSAAASSSFSGVVGIEGALFCVDGGSAQAPTAARGPSDAADLPAHDSARGWASPSLLKLRSRWGGGQSSDVASALQCRQQPTSTAWKGRPTTSVLPFGNAGNSGAAVQLPPQHRGEPIGLGPRSCPLAVQRRPDYRRWLLSRPRFTPACLPVASTSALQLTLTATAY